VVPAELLSYAMLNGLSGLYLVENPPFLFHADWGALILFAGAYKEVELVV
jgi:hypothetical protein